MKSKRCHFHRISRSNNACKLNGNDLAFITPYRLACEQKLTNQPTQLSIVHSPSLQHSSGACGLAYCIYYCELCVDFFIFICTHIFYISNFPSKFYCGYPFICVSDCVICFTDFLWATNEMHSQTHRLV